MPTQESVIKVLSPLVTKSGAFVPEHNALVPKHFNTKRIEVDLTTGLPFLELVKQIQSELKLGEINIKENKKIVRIDSTIDFALYFVIDSNNTPDQTAIKQLLSIVQLTRILEKRATFNIVLPTYDHQFHETGDFQLLLDSAKLGCNLNVLYHPDYCNKTRENTDLGDVDKLIHLHQYQRDKYSSIIKTLLTATVVLAAIAAVSFYFLPAMLALGVVLTCSSTVIGAAVGVESYDSVARQDYINTHSMSPSAQLTLDAPETNCLGQSTPALTYSASQYTADDRVAADIKTLSMLGLNAHKPRSH